MLKSEKNFAGGIRDCGKFFLDFTGSYTSDEVTVTWCDEPRQSNKAIDTLIEKTWLEYTASQSNKKLYDGNLCRLHRYQAGDELSLILGPVRFKEFLGTNLARPNLRYEYGEEYLANALGVSGAIRTSDGFILLGLRSEEVAIHCRMLHPVGGIVEPSGQGQKPPCPFEAMILEVEEETGISRDMIAKIVCMGMVRDKRLAQPELIFDISLSITARQLRKKVASASSNYEHSRIELFADYPARISSFIRTHFDKLTPVAVATLLIHGLRHWGSGWFITTRGYLKSMYG